MSEAAQRLEALVREVRAFLESHWAAWHQHAGAPEGRRTLSEGTCGRSSMFLVQVLRDAGFQAEAAFGSPVEGDCGFRTGKGWKGHGWVIVKAPARIVDITADQFGDCPVIVTGPDDPRYCAGQDVAGQGWIAERQRVARELMQLWRARGLAAGGGSASDGMDQGLGER
ncbi:hypothetical protein [Marimonas lutisalis]|uniref:hypothetical protein n=1 Tax=Marimonas lutisalis TaxID=2545756 RepID=UPI0010F90D37|nr:hypothetical protein [Marimonas lutisalis]